MGLKVFILGGVIVDTEHSHPDLAPVITKWENLVVSLMAMGYLHELRVRPTEWISAKAFFLEK
jgi:hypothetical protein